MDHDISACFTATLQYFIDVVPPTLVLVHESAAASNKCFLMLISLNWE